MHGESSSTPPGAWRLPRDEIIRQDEPTSGRKSEIHSETPSGQEMSLSLSEIVRIFGFTRVDDCAPSEPKLSSRNNATSGNTTTNLNYNCSVDPEMSRRLDRVIAQIMEIPDEPTPLHEDFNKSNAQSGTGSLSANSTYNLISSVNKEKCIEDSRKNKMSSEPNEDLSGAKGTNSEILDVSFKPGPSTLKVGNATDWDTFKVPYQVGTQLVGRRGVEERGGNDEPLNLVINEAVRNQSDKMELCSSRTLTLELPMRSRQKESAMEMNPPLNLENNSVPERARISTSEKRDSNQFLGPNLGSQAGLKTSQMTSSSHRSNPITPTSNKPLDLSGFTPIRFHIELSSSSNLFVNGAKTSLPNVNAASQMSPFPTLSSATSMKVSDNRDQDLNIADGSIHGGFGAVPQSFRSNHESTESSLSHSWRSRRSGRMQSKRLTEYPCNTCPMAFRRAKDLEKHTKETHGRYRCQKCNTQFTTFANLKRHGASHIGYSPFECLLCGSSFPRQDHLKRHMNNRHRGYNAERHTKVRVDTAEFLKYTRISENGVDEDVDHTDAKNLPNNLTSSTTQDTNLQLDTSSVSGHSNNTRREAREHIYLESATANLNSMRKKLNPQEME